MSFLRGLQGVFLVAVALASGCSLTPEEVRIREAIAAMEQAVESREPRSFMAYVADDFNGNAGAVDRVGVHNLLRAQFLRNESIGIVLGPITVERAGERATAKFTATLTGGDGGWLPKEGAVYEFTTGWKNDGGEWRCNNAEWK